MKHTEILAEHLASEPLPPESITEGTVPIGLLVEHKEQTDTRGALSQDARCDSSPDDEQTIRRTGMIDLVAEGQKMLDPKRISKPSSHLDIRTTDDPIVPITAFVSTG